MKNLQKNTRGVYWAARMASVGLELAVSVGVGYFGGQWLENRFGFAPWGSVGGVLLGFAAGLRSLVVTARRASQESDDDDADRR